MTDKLTSQDDHHNITHFSKVEMEKKSQISDQNPLLGFLHFLNSGLLSLEHFVKDIEHLLFDPKKPKTDTTTNLLKEKWDSPLQGGQLVLKKDTASWISNDKQQNQDLKKFEVGKEYTIQGHLSPSSKEGVVLYTNDTSEEIHPDDKGNFSIKIKVPEGGITKIGIKNTKYSAADQITVDKLNVDLAPTPTPTDLQTIIENDPTSQVLLSDDEPSLENMVDALNKKIDSYNKDPKKTQSDHDKLIKEKKACETALEEKKEAFSSFLKDHTFTTPDGQKIRIPKDEIQELTDKAFEDKVPLNSITPFSPPTPTPDYKNIIENDKNAQQKITGYTDPINKEIDALNKQISAYNSNPNKTQKEHDTLCAQVTALETARDQAIQKDQTDFANFLKTATFTTPDGKTISIPADQIAALTQTVFKDKVATHTIEKVQNPQPTPNYKSIIENDPRTKQKILDYVAPLNNEIDVLNKQIDAYNSNPNKTQKDYDALCAQVTDLETTRDQALKQDQTDFASFLKTATFTTPEGKTISIPADQIAALTQTVFKDKVATHTIEKVQNPQPTPGDSLLDKKWTGDKTPITNPDVPGDKQLSYQDPKDHHLVINSVDNTGGAINLTEKDDPAFKDLNAGDEYTLQGKISMPWNSSSQKVDFSKYDRFHLLVSGKELPIKLNADGSFSIQFTVPKEGVHSIGLKNDKDWGTGLSTQICVNTLTLKNADSDVKHDAKMIEGNSDAAKILGGYKGSLSQKIDDFNQKLADYNKMPSLTQDQYKAKHDKWIELSGNRQKIEDEITQDKGSFTTYVNAHFGGQLTIPPAKIGKLIDRIFNDVVSESNTIPKPKEPSEPGPIPTPDTGSQLSIEEETQLLLSDPQTQDLFKALKTGHSNDPQMQALLNPLLQDEQAYKNASSAAEKKPLAEKIKSELYQVHSYIQGKVMDAIVSSSKDPEQPLGWISYDFTDPTELKQHVAMLQIQAYQIDNTPLGNVVPPTLQADSNQFQDSTFDTVSKEGSPWTSSGNVTVKKNGGPFGYDNSVVISSDSSIKQSFKGEPNKEYVVAAYVKSSSDNGIGKIDMTGIQDPTAGHYEDWTSQGGPDGKTPQWHLVYYRVKADKNGDISVNFHTDKGPGNSMEIASAQVLKYNGSTSIGDISKDVMSHYSFPHLSGPVQKGAFPQHKTAWKTGDSFIPGFRATNGLPHQSWWDFGHTTIVEGKNGEEWLKIAPTDTDTASATSKTQTLLPMTSSDTYHFHTVLRNSGGSSVPPSPSITFTAIDNSVTPQEKYTYELAIPKDKLADWKAGKEIVIDKDISATDFKNAQSKPSKQFPLGHHAQIFTVISGYKGSGAFGVSHVELTPNSQSTLQKVNDNWFDNENDPFNNPDPKYDDYKESTDFSKGDTGHWQKLIAGNEDLNPDANFKPEKGVGLPLEGNHNADGSFKTQGVVYPHPLGAQGRGWELDSTFTVHPPNPVHKPVIALWAYGNAEPSGANPLDHVNGGADSMVNEIDMEIGDPDSTQTSQVVYSGKTLGGKAHVTNYPKLPFNVYDGGVYKASIKATRVPDPKTGNVKTEEVKDPKTGEIKTIPLMAFTWSITQIKDASGKPTGITKQVGDTLTRPFNGVVNAVVSTEQMKTTDKNTGNSTVIVQNNTVQAIGPALDPKEYPELAKPSDTDYAMGTPSTGPQGCPFDETDAGLQAEIAAHHPA